MKGQRWEIKGAETNMSIEVFELHSDNTDGRISDFCWTMILAYDNNVKRWQCLKGL